MYHVGDIDESADAVAWVPREDERYSKEGTVIRYATWSRGYRDSLREAAQQVVVRRTPLLIQMNRQWHLATPGTQTVRRSGWKTTHSTRR
ncbi:hypothetical protein VTK56DRAFT_1934 [Thermocarpiscus australiensis]